MRTRVSSWLMASVLALAASCSQSEPTRPAPTVNSAVGGVLLVVCDTLRVDQLGCYGGSVPTPNIDALAARGVRFEENHSQGGHTLPSMLSLMTGLWIAEYSNALSPNQPTLAERLEDAGFATAAFVANPVCSPARGFARGFERFEAFDGLAIHTEVLAEHFESWLARQEADDTRPWFAWVHAMDPHDPYAPRAEFLEGVPEPTADGALGETWRGALADLQRLRPDADGAAFDDWIAPMLADRRNYAGEVRAFDHGLGQIVGALERHGELDGTLIVFASDHGELLYDRVHYPGDFESISTGWSPEQGLADLLVRGHHDWFYPQIWQTPLIAVGPGFAVGAVATGLSANIDIVPTILAVTGVADAASARASGLDGTSLVGVEHVERKLVFGLGEIATAVRDEHGRQWVELPRQISLVPLDSGPSGFLDDGLDPNAVHSAGDAVVVAGLRGAIDRWRAAAHLSPNFDLDRSQDEILRRLGYIDDPAVPGKDRR